MSRAAEGIFKKRKLFCPDIRYALFGDGRIY